ncbi:MAG TPA: hypothetical protein VFQ37_15120 [Mycobacterium sp.]|nr:hypothetical protein [Mycobacterium sp.]
MTATTLHTAAVTSVVLSGAYAQVAFMVGSALEFGVALALCGVWWIAADVTADRRIAAPTVRPHPHSPG